MRRGSVGTIRTVFAVLANLLLPGLGQLLQGRFVAGLTFLLVFFSLFFTLVYFWKSSGVGFILLALFILYLLAITDAGSEPEVKPLWNQKDKRNWTVEENEYWIREDKQIERIRNSTVLTVDDAVTRYPSLVLGNLGILLEVDKHCRVRVIFPKLTPKVDLEYVDSWHNSQFVHIPNLEKMDGQNKLDFRIASILALPVKEHLQFVEPEILNLRRQQHKISELLNLVTKSAIYGSRQESYERALLQVEDLLNKAEELEHLYVRLIREILIGKQVAGMNFQLSAAESSSIDNLVKQVRQEYQSMKNSATAYTDLLRTGQI